MLAWATFAYILGNEVTNIGVFEPNEYDKANMIAKATHGDGAMAVDVTYIPVHVGDTYDNGRFYRNGEEVVPFETESNRINVLEAQSSSTADSLSNIELALIELYESEG